MFKRNQYFGDLQAYLLSEEGQLALQKEARRTWYGGINNEADKSIFNPDWGIDTSKYITSVKFPSTSVIKKALMLYQTSLRKPIHVVFCLDYSGSMVGKGITELRNAMEYILTDKAKNDYLQFSNEDKIDVIPFASTAKEVWSTSNGNDTSNILRQINSKTPRGSTALYEASIEGLKLLQKEDLNKYNVSVILMTDGEGNVGSLFNLENEYKNLKTSIPIYSIMFGEAQIYQLQEIADLTNAKVFDGRTDLVAAFKEVRGYN